MEDLIHQNIAQKNCRPDNNNSINASEEISNIQHYMTDDNLTIRDKFAMCALPSIIVTAGHRTYQADAESAYKYADAMMAERSKPRG